MAKGDNSDVMKHVLQSFINVVSTKTSQAHAWLTLKVLLKKLVDNYVFLKHVDIVDKKFLVSYQPELQTSDPYFIDFLSDIDDIDPKEIGKAIQSLADILKKYLGDKAGYFFMQEFISNLGDYYYSLVKNMGVDFRLIELQDEVFGLETQKYKINEDSKANIAFVKKIEDTKSL